MADFPRTTLPVYLTYALMSIGMAVNWQFVTLFVKHELGAPDFITLTIVWAAPAFINMAAVNFWGHLSDRLQKRKPFMVLGFSGYAATFLAYSFVTTSIQYLLVALLGAVLSSAALPVGQAYLTTSTTKKGEHLGLLVAAQSVGWFIGALMSGLLYDILGMFILYRIAAILCVGAMLGGNLLIKEIPFDMHYDIDRSGFKDLLKKPGIGKLTAAVACSQIGINAIAFMFAIMMVDELGGLAAYVGIANSTATLIAIIATGYIGRAADKHGPAKILTIAMLSYVIFSVGFAMVQDPVAATIMWALPIYPLSTTAAFALAAGFSDEQERAQAMSLTTGAQNAGAAIGPIVGGLFAEYVFGRVQPVSWITMCFNFVAMLLAISLWHVSWPIADMEKMPSVSSQS